MTCACFSPSPIKIRLLHTSSRDKVYYSDGPDPSCFPSLIFKNLKPRRPTSFSNNVMNVRLWTLVVVCVALGFRGLRYHLIRLSLTFESTPAFAPSLSDVGPSSLPLAPFYSKIDVSCNIPYRLHSIPYHGLRLHASYHAFPCLLPGSNFFSAAIIFRFPRRRRPL